MEAKEFLKSKGLKDTLYDVTNKQPDQWIKGGLSALLEEYAATRDSQSAVPSAEWDKIFREIWDLGNEFAGADHPEDFFEEELLNWKTKRGIAG